MKNLFSFKYIKILYFLLTSLTVSTYEIRGQTNILGPTEKEKAYLNLVIFSNDGEYFECPAVDKLNALVAIIYTSYKENGQLYKTIKEISDKSFSKLEPSPQDSEREIILKRLFCIIFCSYKGGSDYEKFEDILKDYGFNVEHQAFWMASFFLWIYGSYCYPYGYDRRPENSSYNRDEKFLEKMISDLQEDFFIFLTMVVGHSVVNMFLNALFYLSRDGKSLLNFLRLHLSERSKFFFRNIIKEVPGNKQRFGPEVFKISEAYKKIIEKIARDF